MSALTTPRTPSSYQLRLISFNCRNSPSVFLRLRVRKLGRQIRCASVSSDSGNGNVNDKQTNSNFSVDVFSGWSNDSNGGQELNDSQPKKGLYGVSGIVGAGVVGVIFVSGLTFAALSISKSANRPKQNMESLTTHQEHSLVFADQSDAIEEDESKGENAMLDNRHLEGKTGVDKDSSSYDKENETTAENKLAHNNNLEFTSIGGEALNNAAIQEDFQEELPRGEAEGGPVRTPKKHESDVRDDSVDASIIQDSDDNLVAEKSKSSIELNKGPTYAKTIASLVPDLNPSSIRSTSIFDSVDLGNVSFSASIPAPSVVSPALQAFPGKLLVPAVVDQIQGQALAALQVLKVVDGDIQPGDLCTRREYARWLVSASSALSRSTTSKVYPAMYIENVTELAFDDITPEDPDFSSIQGLAEAGLIAGKLSRCDTNSSDQDKSSLCFCPESPLSRQDLVSWKMSLEKRLLPVADRTILQQCSGFLDIDKINPDACPAIIADLSAGEQGIIGLAFGYTRLFQPDKPVTKAQAAIALATGEASDIVSEELARIEAESVAEKAVAAHNALVAQVEKDVNAEFEKGFLLEREKINAVEKMAEEATLELERLRAEREEENIRLVKERSAVDSEMQVLSRLRHEVEEQLQGVMSNKVEISYEKERINKLRTDTEIENQEIERLQHELEVERKALSVARAWAEDEAKRAREQAKVLEEARDHWGSQGIKIVVDDDLREEADAAGVTWHGVGNQFSIEGTKSRAGSLVTKLKGMAAGIRGKSRETIDKVINKILFLVSQLKEWASNAGKQANKSIQGLQQSSVGLISGIKDGAKRVVRDCRGGVERLTQKFKT